MPKQPDRQHRLEEVGFFVPPTRQQVKNAMPGLPFSEHVYETIIDLMKTNHSDLQTAVAKLKSDQIGEKDHAWSK